MEKIAKKIDEQSFEDTFPHADEAIENAKVTGEEYWKAAKEKGQDFWKRAQSTRRQSWSQASGFIQKNPVRAVVYAVLAGVAIGAFLKSNRKD